MLWSMQHGEVVVVDYDPTIMDMDMAVVAVVEEVEAVSLAVVVVSLVDSLQERKRQDLVPGLWKNMAPCS
jgi:hypothetical protein